MSLLKWKDADAQRVAAQVVQPYARAYAMRLTAMVHNDDRVTVAVQGQLDQYRWDYCPEGGRVGGSASRKSRVAVKRGCCDGLHEVG